MILVVLPKKPKHKQKPKSLTQSPLTDLACEQSQVVSNASIPFRTYTRVPALPKLFFAFPCVQQIDPPSLPIFASQRKQEKENRQEEEKKKKEKEKKTKSSLV